MVAVILGVLGSIVVFAVQNLTQSGAVASCRSDYRTVEAAEEAYKASMGNYPSGSSGGTPSAAPFTDAGAPGDNAAGPDAELLVSAATAPNSEVGSAAGPWLREVPSNSGHYTISVANDGSGLISVTTPSSGASCNTAI